MSQQNTTKGVLCALGAYFIWGVAPIYFKSIKEVPAEEILTHRIIWSFFLCCYCSLFHAIGVISAKY